MLSLSNNLVSIAIWINLLQTIWIVIYLSRDSEFVQWRWDRHSDAPRLGGRHVSQLVFLSVRVFFESLLIDQNFTGWNTIKRSFHKNLLCTIFTFTLYIFFDNLKETTNMIKCGSDYKNRIMFFRGSLVLKQHSRAGKTVNPLAISLKHIYKCFIQTCLRAICFYTVRTTELIYTQGSKVYHDYISFSLIFYLKLSFSNKIFQNRFCTVTFLNA